MELVAPRRQVSIRWLVLLAAGPYKDDVEA